MFCSRLNSPSHEKSGCKGTKKNLKNKEISGINSKKTAFFLFNSGKIPNFALEMKHQTK